MKGRAPVGIELDEVRVFADFEAADFVIEEHGIGRVEGDGTDIAVLAEEVVVKHVAP